MTKIDKLKEIKLIPKNKMKVNFCAILLIVLCSTASADPVKLTGRTLLRKRLDKYFYFTTSGVESQLDKIDKMD